MGSLPPREHVIVMLAISTRTKEITTNQAEQQTMQELITSMVDKALVFYTHLFDVQVVAGPLIEQLKITDLTTSQVIAMEVEAAIKLTQDL
jgi:hypothetical protein